LTAEAAAAGGFYAINRRGQVLLATVNEATIVPFVSVQVLMLCSAATDFLLFGDYHANLAQNDLKAFCSFCTNSDQ
jgi:hypothetical protein